MKSLLSDAVDAYLLHRQSQDYSKGTINLDKQVLKRFLATNGNVWCHQITDKHVARHFDGANRTRGVSSLRNDHGVLNRFFAWARHTGRMPVDTDPMFGRRQPKLLRRERNRVPVQDFDRLLKAAGERDPRDRALLAMLLYTLLRDSEVTSLRLYDLDLEGGWITAKIHKTRQEDRIPICEELDAELRAWLTHYTKAVGPLDPGFFLIPPRIVSPINGADGRISHHRQGYRPTKKMGPSGKVVTRALEDIGFPVKDADGKALHEGAHTLRRSGARALFDQLVDGGYDHSLRLVQSLLHHASVTMTERYIGITADRRTRDEVLRGKRMYHTSSDNVVAIRQA